MKSVIDLAVPGTEMDAIRWYNDVYRQYADLKVALAGQDAGMTVQAPSRLAERHNPGLRALFNVGTAIRRLDLQRRARTQSRACPSQADARDSLFWIEGYVGKLAARRNEDV